MSPQKAQRIADHLLESANKLQELGAFNEAKRVHYNAGWWLAYVSYARLELAMKRATRLRSDRQRAKNEKAKRSTHARTD